MTRASNLSVQVAILAWLRVVAGPRSRARQRNPTSLDSADSASRTVRGRAHRAQGGDLHNLVQGVAMSSTEQPGADFEPSEPGTYEVWTVLGDLSEAWAPVDVFEFDGRLVIHKDGIAETVTNFRWKPLPRPASPRGPSAAWWARLAHSSPNRV